MTPDQLRSLAVKDLRTVAAGHGIAKAAKMTKPDLLTALLPLIGTAHAPSPGAGPAGSSSGGSVPVAARPPQSPPGADPGLPIPDSYVLDRLVLLVQDPHHVFAYWELTGGHLDAALQSAGEGATPVLVLHTPGGPEQREVDLRGGNYYLSVAPGAQYRAELALRDRQGRLVMLATSNAVSTPASTISARSDERWMGVNETFHELLALAGLPGQVAGDSSLSRFLAAQQQVAAWATEAQPSGSSGSLSSHSLSSSVLTKPAG